MPTARKQIHFARRRIIFFTPCLTGSLIVSEGGSIAKEWSARGARQASGRIEAFPALVTKQSARDPRNGSQRPTLRDRIDECQGMTSFSTDSMIAKRNVAMTEMVTRTAKTKAVSI